MSELCAALGLKRGHGPRSLQLPALSPQLPVWALPSPKKPLAASSQLPACVCVYGVLIIHLRDPLVQRTGASKSPFLHHPLSPSHFQLQSKEPVLAQLIDEQEAYRD